jgi:hypothetical protein
MTTCQKAYTLFGRLAHNGGMRPDSMNAAIACYCRVSSMYQKNDAQISEIGRWLSANGLAPADV